MAWIGVILGWLIPLFIIGAIVYFIVRGRRDGNGFSAYHGLMTYFYFIIGASVVTMTIGVALLLFVAFQQAYNGGSISDTIALGLTLAGTGVVICVLHMFGKQAVQKKDVKGTRSIKRVYLFFMLSIFSVAGLVSLPVAVYAFAHYYIEGSRHWEDPSAALATAIVVVPMWAYYLMRVMQETRATKKRAAKDTEATGGG